MRYNDYELAQMQRNIVREARDIINELSSRVEQGTDDGQFKHFHIVYQAMLDHMPGEVLET